MENYMELQKENLKTAADYIVKINLGIDTIVDKFNGGLEEVAVDLSVQLIEGLRWLIDSFRLTKELQDRCGVEIDYKNANDIFFDITEAFENSDYVLISDLLEYELKPITEQWQDKLFELVEGSVFNDMLH